MQHMSRTFPRLAVAVAMAAAAALTACSSGSSGSSSSGSASASATPGGATPWKIATIGGYSGYEAPGQGGCADAMTAWAASVNHSGGIDGHPVELIKEDDQGSPTTALSVAEDAIVTQHVDAIVGVCSDFDAAWNKLAIQHKVPVIGGVADNSTWTTSPYYFPTGTTLDAFSYSVAYGAKLLGATKLANLYCAETSTCEQIVPAIKAAGDSLGINSVYSAAVAGSSPSYAAPCIAANGAGAQAVFVAAVSGVLQRLAASCSMQNYEPSYIVESTTLYSTLPAVPQLDNKLIGITETFPWLQDDTPATKAFHEAMNTYAPGNADADTPAASLGWMAATVFEFAAKQATAVSSAALLHALGTIKNQTFGGLSFPITYHAGAGSGPLNCFYAGITINGGKYALRPNADKFYCAP